MSGSTRRWRASSMKRSGRGSGSLRRLSRPARSDNRQRDGEDEAMRGGFARRDESSGSYGDRRAAYFHYPPFPVSGELQVCGKTGSNRFGSHSINRQIATRQAPGKSRCRCGGPRLRDARGNVSLRGLLSAPLVHFRMRERSKQLLFGPIRTEKNSVRPLPILCVQGLFQSRHQFCKSDVVVFLSGEHQKRLYVFLSAPRCSLVVAGFHDEHGAHDRTVRIDRGGRNSHPEPT